MKKRVPAGVKVLLIVNSLGLLGFAFLLFVQPVFTDVQVRMNWTQLDREGVSNEDALAKFHPSYGFTSELHRNPVPRYIAQPALGAQTANAGIGLVVAGVNPGLALWALWAPRRTRKPAERVDA